MISVWRNISSDRGLAASHPTRSPNAPPAPACARKQRLAPRPDTPDRAEAWMVGPPGQTRWHAAPTMTRWRAPAVVQPVFLRPPRRGMRLPHLDTQVHTDRQFRIARPDRPATVRNWRCAGYIFRL